MLIASNVITILEIPVVMIMMILVVAVAMKVTAVVAVKLLEEALEAAMIEVLREQLPRQKHLKLL